MSENDAQLGLKKRARRRLVGAVALAALAAVVLPMVMDQEPKPGPQDIQVLIPSQDAGPFSSRILPVKPGAVPTPLPPAVTAETKPAAPAAKPEPAKAEPEPAKVVAAVPETPAEPPPEKPASSANDKREPAGAEPAPKGEQWILQIGAYRDPANIRNLQAKLKEQGYNFYTEPLISDGVKKTRLRAGPFQSKEAAAKARDRLKRIGVEGIVAQKQ